MSHGIYQTEGIVIAEYPTGEASKTFGIFTERFGYIFAKATSIRKSSSKLRGSLHLLSHVRVDLVSGRKSWKVIGVKEIKSGISTIDGNEYNTFFNMMSLVKKFAGEEQNKKLFRDILYFYNLFCLKNECKSKIKLVETIGTIRILNHLGYWNNEDRFLIDSDPTDEEVIDFVDKSHDKLLYEINSSIAYASV